MFGFRKKKNEPAKIQRPPDTKKPIPKSGDDSYYARALSESRRDDSDDGVGFALGVAADIAETIIVAEAVSSLFDVGGSSDSGGGFDGGGGESGGGGASESW